VGGGEWVGGWVGGWVEVVVVVVVVDWAVLLISSTDVMLLR